MGWRDWLTRTDAPALPAPPVVDTRRDERRKLLDAAENILTGLGSATRDKAQAVRPGVRQPLSDEECWLAYRHIGLVRRAVGLRAGDACRRGWRIEAGDELEDPLAQAWDGLGVRAAVRSALRWSMVYKGAAILMVTGDTLSDPSQYARPLTPGAKVVALRVIYGKGSLTPSTWSSSIVGDGRPETWQVRPDVNVATFECHRSRLLLFPGLEVPLDKLPEYDGLGQSYIDAVWEAIAQDEQVSAAGAQLAVEMKQALLKIKGLADIATEDQAQLVDLRIRALMKSMGTVGIMLMDTEDEFEQKASPSTGYKELSESSRTRVAAWLGIPQAKLYGVAPGGMSTDDKAQMANWRDVVADIQETTVRPALEQLARVMFASAEPPRWRLEFEALDEPTELEQAEVELKHAQADLVRVQSGVLDPDHIARSRFGPRGYSAHIMPLAEEDLDVMAQVRDPDEDDLAVLRRR